MARDFVSRPVSGEILARRRIRGGEDELSERDIVEAEYETVVGRHQKLERAVSEPVSGEASIFGLGILTGEEDEDRGKRAGPAFWLVSVILVATAFWISGGHALMPISGFKTASVQQSPIAIEDVRSRIENRSTNPYLLVDGSVSNKSGQAVPLPDLIIQIKLVDGSITRYRITGGNENIVAGGRYAFSSRLPAPNKDVENVKVMMQGGN